MMHQRFVITLILSHGTYIMNQPDGLSPQHTESVQEKQSGLAAKLQQSAISAHCLFSLSLFLRHDQAVLASGHTPIMGLSQEHLKGSGTSPSQGDNSVPE